MPDFEGHNLTKYKGRKLFYSQDKNQSRTTKINWNTNGSNTSNVKCYVKNIGSMNFSEHFTLTLEP